MSEAQRRAVFLDKDGTLVDDVPYNVDPAKVTLTHDALPGLALMRDLGFDLVVVTNQPGIDMGLFDLSALDRLQQHLQTLLGAHGIDLAGFESCPHLPSAACDCRKPRPGMLERSAARLGLDLERSWMVGDILNDVEAGRRAGCRTILLDVGNETEWNLEGLRRPHYRAVSLLDAARQIMAAAP